MKTAVLIVISTILWPIAGIAKDPEGDPARGAAKAGACMTCHGPNGVSKYLKIPTLAGQRRGYLVRQLKAFRNTALKKEMPLEFRRHPSMSNQVLGLNITDIVDLAAFFASQDCRPSNTARPKEIPEAAHRCQACHGDVGGTGRYSLIPKLFGQNRYYLQNQLLAFFTSSGKNKKQYTEGERYHRIMSRQARFFKFEDIKNAAAYFASISCR